MSADVPSRSLSGRIALQFKRFNQAEMSTDSLGNQVFLGTIVGTIGLPPSGTSIEVVVKMSTGASFTDGAYEISVDPALAHIGARPEVRNAAFAYVDSCMTILAGPGWKTATGLTAINNVFVVDGPVEWIELPESRAGW